MTRRTKAPTPFPIKVQQGVPHKDYNCTTCEMHFTVYWGRTLVQPFCPKCGENADVSRFPSQRRKVRTFAMPRWTKEQKDELWNLYTNTSLTYKEIGEKIGRSAKSITHIMRRMRLEVE